MLHSAFITTAAALLAFAGLAQAGESQPQSGAGQASWQNGIHRTDLARHDLEVPGYESIQARVDIDPGVASPRHSHPGAEVAHARKIWPSGFFVVPGVRPAGSSKADQKRAVTPRQALDAGASILVIGRPITQATEPDIAAREIEATL